MMFWQTTGSFLTRGESNAYPRHKSQEIRRDGLFTDRSETPPRAVEPVPSKQNSSLQGTVSSLDITDAQNQIMKLECLQVGAVVRGVRPDGLVTVVSVQWFGSAALELTYKTPIGKVEDQLLYRNDEPRLEIAKASQPWSFDGDGALFRLASEAQRIDFAHLFDPVLAVHTSIVEPLPHQITAVYESMLPRQPLRFLLADDPGSGKTIMAGLLMKELIARSDLQRCLIVCPGSLAEQWQDELDRKFQLPFDILTSDKLKTARTGNWFIEDRSCNCSFRHALPK